MTKFKQQALNLNQIFENYDILFLDAYGVLKAENGCLYPGVPELLRQMRQAQKKVFILSNSPTVSPELAESYAHIGLIESLYDRVISSGDLLDCYLQNRLFPLAGNKIYIFGADCADRFNRFGYEVTDNPREAAAFYISVPQLNEAQVTANSQLSACFFESCESCGDGQQMWDSLTMEPFLPSLQKLADIGLTAINANPDCTAGVAEKGSGTGHFVIRQGSVAEAYRKMGGNVIELGKPHSNIYQFAAEIAGAGADDKMAMVGDQFATDILGAINARRELGLNIDPILVLEQGVANQARLKGESWNAFCQGQTDKIIAINKIAAL